MLRNEWECPHCGELNFVEDEYCAACGEDRDE